MNPLSQFIDSQAGPTSTQAAVETKAAAAVNLSQLTFSWPKNPSPVLNIENLQITSGERVFVQGPSGSGKSTLLSLIGGVLLPCEGEVSVLGERVDAMSCARRDRFRADHIGFVFQMFNLLPYLTVEENVTLPCRFSQRRKQMAEKQSKGLHEESLRLLGHLNMDDPDLLKRPVTELSVGQQQRVAAARALIGSPEIVIADEPTSSLDSDHRQAFIQLLFEECERGGSTLIFVSHDTGLAGSFDRTVRLSEINRT